MSAPGSGRRDFEARHLRIERAQICRQRDHVVVVELFDHLLHQLDPRALTIADLHVVELAEDVGRGPARDARHLAEALEISDRDRSCR